MVWVAPNSLANSSFRRTTSITTIFSAPDDGNSAARFNFRGVYDSADTGGNRTTDERRFVEWRVLAHGNDGIFGNDRIFRHRSKA